MTTFKSIAACAGLGMIGVVAWQTMAGDLNPPVGPVSPTMCTLEDICARLDAFAASEGWSSQFLPPLPSNAATVLSGSGVLHAVIMPEHTGILLFDTASGFPQRLIGRLHGVDGVASLIHTVDLRFENSLLVADFGGAGTSNTGCWILYRLD